VIHTGLLVLYGAAHPGQSSGQKVVYFGSRVQKVVYFPSDNSDLLSSHFSVQSEVHYFWTVSGRILVYSQKYTTFGPSQVAF
jgi:hypothetical protein